MTKFVPLTILCTILVCSILNAQSPKRSFTLSAGIGIVPAYSGKNAKSEVLPVILEAEYRISNKFSLGAYAGYTAVKSDPKVLSDGIESSTTNKTSMVGLRGQLHKDFTEKIEIYGGTMLGYAFFNTTEKAMRTGDVVIREQGAPTPFDPNAPKGQFVYSGFVGSKYALSKKMRVYAEIGLGVALVSTGFSFQL